MAFSSILTLARLHEPASALRKALVLDSTGVGRAILLAGEVRSREVRADALQRRKHGPGRVIAPLPACTDSAHACELDSTILRYIASTCLAKAASAVKKHLFYLHSNISAWPDPLGTTIMPPNNQRQRHSPNRYTSTFITASRYPAHWMPIVLARKHLAAGAMMQGPPG